MKYLASPYSHPDPEERAYRFEAVCRLTARLMKRGVVVVSPIVHSHPVFVRYPETGADFESWQELDFALLDACDEMWIADLSGWGQSRGVAAERKYAEDTGKPVRIVNWRTGVVEATLYDPASVHDQGEAGEEGEVPS